METNLTTTQKPSSVFSWSFWKKPDKGFAALLNVGIVGFVLYKVLPIALAICTTGIELAIAFIALLALIYLISVILKHFWLINLTVSRSIVGFFVELNPIAILKNSIHEMKENLEKIEKFQGELNASIEKTKESIETKKAKKDGDIKKLMIVQNTITSRRHPVSHQSLTDHDLMSYQSQQVVLTNSINLADETIAKAETRLQKEEKCSKIIDKAIIMAKTKIEIGENHLNNKKEEYEDAKRYSAISKAFKSIFSSADLSHQEAEELAWEKINDTIAEGNADLNSIFNGLDNGDISFDLDMALADNAVNAIISKYNSSNIFDTDTDAAEVEEVEYVNIPAITDKNGSNKANSDTNYIL